MGLEIHSDPLYQLAQPWSVECDGQRVGAITSAVYSPDLDANIALAMVGVECAGVGTKLVVDLGQEKVDATISNLPFIDNKEKVWRGIMDD